MTNLIDDPRSAGALARMKAELERLILAAPAAALSAAPTSSIEWCCGRGHDHADAHGERHLRAHRGARGPPLGRADPALAAALQDLRRAHAARAHPRPGPGQEGVCARQHGARPPGREEGAGHRHRGGRGVGRKTRRRVPARDLADGQRHPEQHEHERGAGQPGQRAPGRAARRGAPRPPQRRRQHGPVLERRLPHRHARGRGRGHPQARPSLREGPARHAAEEGRRVPRHREDRPHPPAGRDAAHPGPGVLGLRLAARPRARSPRRGAAPPVRAGPGRHRRRHRPQRPSRVRGARRPEAGGGDRTSLRDRAQQVRGAGQPRRAW